MSKREQAAKILNQYLGWSVDADNIKPVIGYWKSQDVYRWEVNTGKGLFGCWETLTEFCRLASKNGCILQEYTIHPNE